MTIDRYFQDELAFLRESGQEFSQHFPQLTSYLSDRSNDPDVERLLEGFALLTGRIREKIDDQLPEVTQSLLTLLWPNFLRQVPSMTILQMDPVPGAISERQTVESGSMVESVPKFGTKCMFRMAYDVDVFPMSVTKVQHDVSKEKSIVVIQLRTLNGEGIKDIGLQSLRFFLGGADYSAQTINLWLHRYLNVASVRSPGSSDSIPLADGAIKQVGMDRTEDVLPYPPNAFVGYRLLQEFYAFPEKYRFFDALDVPLSHLPNDTDTFELVLDFSRPMPPDVRVGKESFALHCAPAINLFPHDSEPMLLDAKRQEYLVQPARRDGGEIEIFSIEKVTGWSPSKDGKSGGISRDYSRFESFAHEIERVDGRASVYFRERVRQSISGEELDRLLSFVREDELSQIADGETVSVELICTNGVAPHDLSVGDVCVPTQDIPSFVNPGNLTRPTMPRYPIVDGTLQWQLISALSLNYLSLQSADALRTILSIYDYNAKVDRQREREAQQRLAAIEKIESRTVDRLFAGLPVRGMRTEMHIQERKFACEGEMFMFASVLAEFFALYASINSFHELIVKGIDAGEEYRWTARIGNQPVL